MDQIALILSAIREAVGCSLNSREKIGLEG